MRAKVRSGDSRSSEVRLEPSPCRRAARAYKDINLNGLKLLLPGGQLFTFSCSGAVDVDLFQKIVAGAVFDAKVDAWAVGRFGGGIDHPLLMTYPKANT